MADRVLPIKNEVVGAGEGSDDDEGFPAQTDPTEDRLACHGLYAGEFEKDGSDKLVTLYRENDKWYFEDTDHAGASRRSLSQLATSVIQITNLVTESGSATFETIQKFIYGGSDNWGMIAMIQAIVWTENITRPGYIRILDSTNGLVIAVLSAFANTSEAILSLGTISNVPTSAAVFEVQIRIASATFKVHCDTIAMKMT